MKKKSTIIIVLSMLETESSKASPLSQDKLATFANAVGYSCNRKTVGRDIKLLKELGYPIVRTSRGYYMDNKAFSNAEMFFIFKCIEACDSGDIDKESLVCRLRKVMGHSYVRSGGGE